jgi:RimJ/RimL family protein N-acetyltransferase
MFSPVPAEAVLTNVAAQISGARVQLKRPEEGDGEAVYEAVVESLADLRRWSASLPWAIAEPSPAASEAFCRLSKSQFIARSRLPYLVFHRETSSFIGCIGVNRMDWQVPRFEIGFWCRTSCQGQGLMTEALVTLIDYLWREHGARRIECVTDLENHKARGVCERAGLAHESTVRNDRATPSGELRHSVVYASVS